MKNSNRFTPFLLAAAFLISACAVFFDNARLAFSEEIPASALVLTAAKIGLSTTGQQELQAMLDVGIRDPDAMKQIFAEEGLVCEGEICDWEGFPVVEFAGPAPATSGFQLDAGDDMAHPAEDTFKEIFKSASPEKTERTGARSY